MVPGRYASCASHAPYLAHTLTGPTFAPTSRGMWTADFRDVVFQANPFLQVPEATERHAPELLLPQEDRVIGTCIINGPMVRRCFGREALAAVGNRSVICSGVLLGTPRAYTALSAIASLVRRCPLDKMSDQASLNYVVYSREGNAKLVEALRQKKEGETAEGGEGERGRKLAEPLRIAMQPRGAGYTNTVGTFKGAHKVLQFEREHMRGGVILNEDATVSAVIHQFDRMLKSTGPTAVHRDLGRTDQVLRIRAVDDALGGPRPNTSWLPNGA